MAVISSKANSTVKELRALRNRRERDRNGLFFADSARLVTEALRAEASIQAVVAVPDRLDGPDRETVATARAAGAQIIEVTGDVYDSISFRGDPDSMGAVVEQRHEPLPPRPAGELSWVALQEIQHPGNLGTILRTSDAAGGAGVILIGPSTDPYHPIAVRGSLGAIFSQRVPRCAVAEFRAWLEAYRPRVIGTSPGAATDYRDATYTPPVVVLSGGERLGLTPEQLALCDEVVRIPMLGRVDSLNLSIATALVLYEVARRNA